MNNIRKQNGFALIQVLIIAILLFSLMYSFTRLNQTKQRHINQKNVGNIASVLINELLDNTVHESRCTGGDPYPMEKCLDVSDTIKETLKNMGIDTSTATVTVTDVRTD